MSTTRRHTTRAYVDLERVAPIDVVVDHRRQQRCARCDRVEVAREVQVHVFHRNDSARNHHRQRHPSYQSLAQGRFADTNAAFLPMRFRPSPKPTVVVVLPSPAGVGLIAVTRISLPSVGLERD